MKLIRTIEKTASWSKVAWLFIICTFLIAAIISKLFGTLKIDYKTTVDAQFFYNSDFFFKAVKNQGATARHDYILLHLLDYVFITQMTMLLSFLIILLLRKFFKTKKLDFLCLLPLIYAPFDILENLTVDISIAIFPIKAIFFATVAPYFTLLKTVFISISELSVIFIIFALLIRLAFKLLRKSLSH